jgi:pimeloyl-ACP methyl ester carboxylesterase
LRLIGIDRPGYGLSTLHPGRTINDWATNDGIAVADALGLERFLVCGISTGGSYAVCMAANFPDRVIAVVMGCAMTDMRNPKAFDNWTFRRAMKMPIQRSAAIEAAKQEPVDLVMRRGSRIVEFFVNSFLYWVLRFPAADLAFIEEMKKMDEFNPELAEFCRQQTNANNHEGYVDDRIADCSRGWFSFDVSKVSCPVIVVHGNRDPIVPVVHASITKELIPHAEVRLYPNLGHLSVVQPVLKALQELAGTGPTLSRL